MSVDGIDCQIPEHGPEFSSHKYAKKSALRYEVALNIQTGDICWINGGFLAGSWPDLEIFRKALITYLEPFERVEADDGYIGEAPQKVRCPKSITTKQERKRMMAFVRMRHETVNRRLKQWRILKGVFRHEITLHSTAFSAVAVMTQIAISQGEPLFQVHYSDNVDVSDEEDKIIDEDGDSEEEELVEAEQEKSEAEDDESDAEKEESEAEKEELEDDL